MSKFTRKVAPAEVLEVLCRELISFEQVAEALQPQAWGVTPGPAVGVPEHTLTKVSTLWTRGGTRKYIFTFFSPWDDWAHGRVASRALQNPA